MYIQLTVFTLGKMVGDVVLVHAGHESVYA